MTISRIKQLHALIGDAIARLDAAYSAEGVDFPDSSAPYDPDSASEHATTSDASAAQSGTVMNSRNVCHAVRVRCRSRRMRDWRREDVGAMRARRPGGRMSLSSAPSSSSSPSGARNVPDCCEGAREGTREAVRNAALEGPAAGDAMGSMVTSQ